MNSENKFGEIYNTIDNSRNLMSDLIRIQKGHKDYIVKLINQVLELGGEPIPYPEELLK